MYKCVFLDRWRPDWAPCKFRGDGEAKARTLLTEPRGGHESERKREREVEGGIIETMGASQMGERDCWSELLRTYASDSLTERPPEKARAPKKTTTANMRVRMIQPIQAKAMSALVELQ